MNFSRLNEVQRNRMMCESIRKEDRIRLKYGKYNTFRNSESSKSVIFSQQMALKPNKIDITALKNVYTDISIKNTCSNSVEKENEHSKKNDERLNMKRKTAIKIS
ncbi:MAG: hypothetical protein MHPSP_000849 [Paramarteilia canceri]